jgi:transposase
MSFGEEFTMTSVGIDISQKTFDATMIECTGTRHHRQFANTTTGFRQLQTWLKPHPVTEVHVCMEATNVYWEDLADTLFQAGCRVSVVNPARTKGFGISQLQRNKTDKVDSGVIADFCACTAPRLWHPPRPEQRQLRDLVRHLEALKKTRTQQLNRLKSCRNDLVKQSLQTVIETLNAQMKTIHSHIETLFTAHATLRQQRKLLISIKGIGKTTATKILAEMYDLEEYSHARAAAADVGVSPAHYESGTSVRRRARLCNVGKASLRGALYWPAITAMQHNPIIHHVKERLEQRGKPTGVIVGAAMRKLLHLAYGVLKNNTPFDPEYGKKRKQQQSIQAHVTT